MLRTQSSRLVLMLAVALLSASCRAFEVESARIALISVPTTLAGDGFTTAPSAFFIDGNGVSLASTIVGQEGCIVRALSTPPGNLDFSYLNAGESVMASFAGVSAVLTRRTVENRTTYALPEGTSIPFTPGENITITIPGAAGGFPARTISAPTVEAFTPAPVTLPASVQADMPVTWSPAATTLVGSAIFYAFRYASAGAIAADREIACVFADDGTGVVPSGALTEYRVSTMRSATAQRARITADRVGTAITHVTSTFQVPVELTETP